MIRKESSEPLRVKNNSNFCENCGAEAVIQCQSCQASIPGGYKDIGYIGTRSPPKFCNMCGVAYPWTEKKIAKISESVKNADIDENQRESIEKDLEKLKNSQLDEDDQKNLTDKLKKAGKELWDSAKPILGDLITEAVKKYAGL